MDLETLDIVAAANEGYELQLKHPTSGEELPVFITVLGRDSDEFQRLDLQQNRARLKRINNPKQRNKAADPEELRAEAMTLLACCVKSWRTVYEDGERPTIKLHGEELQCNEHTALRLLKEMPWIREQVDGAIVDRANFIQG